MEFRRSRTRCLLLTERPCSFILPTTVYNPHRSYKSVLIELVSGSRWSKTEGEATQTTSDRNGQHCAEITMTMFVVVHHLHTLCNDVGHSLIQNLLIWWNQHFFFPCHHFRANRTNPLLSLSGIFVCALFSRAAAEDYGLLGLKRPSKTVLTCRTHSPLEILEYCTPGQRLSVWFLEKRSSICSLVEIV